MCESQAGSPMALNVHQSATVVVIGAVGRPNLFPPWGPTETFSLAPSRAGADRLICSLDILGDPESLPDSSLLEESELS